MFTSNAEAAVPVWEAHSAWSHVWGWGRETLRAPDPSCVCDAQICVRGLFVCVLSTQLHPGCPAVRRGSQSSSQMGVLRVVQASTREEEDSGTWAKAWMEGCSWSWLTPSSDSPTLSPPSLGHPQNSFLPGWGLPLNCAHLAFLPSPHFC